MLRCTRLILQIFVCLSVLLGVGAAHAQGVPDDSANSIAASNSGTVLVVPDGSGESLAEAGCTITVTVIDASTLPIAGYSRLDIWVQDRNAADLSLCLGGILADHDTDAQGRTTLTGPIAGGGFSEGPLYVYLAGNPVLGSPLDIRVVSPDLNGDLIVNMADLGAFAIDYASGTAPPRSDFNADGRVNLVDVGVFGLANGVSCP